ncbi:hypothetical protein FA13DRAFT_1793883 [Coprinellus micaceus]|uniref:Uncharacterized protein n=1 Tax=Coprinellus micaceus TaxID=71717 RepID=A0A4Y7T3H3_COPMI|nr:hypothetical protein FA13DRAFT_1793883 [Coprinellus micaceus]
MHAWIQAGETSQDRLRGECRARCPPILLAPVFKWALGRKENVCSYLRVSAPAKWRTDTPARYGKNRKRYDAFFNEWDCCNEFGDLTQGEQDLERSMIPYDRQVVAESSTPSNTFPGPAASSLPAIQLDGFATPTATLTATDPPPDPFRPDDPKKSKRRSGFFTGTHPPLQALRFPKPNIQPGRFWGHRANAPKPQGTSYLQSRPYISA